jgi:hypothetical protein
VAGQRIPDLTAIAGANTANNDSLLIFDANANATKRILRSQLAIGLTGDLPLQYYLGVLNSNPTTRLDGSPLQLGDYYLDAVTYYTSVYDGSGWTSYASVIAAQTAAEAAQTAAEAAQTAAEAAQTAAEAAQTAAELAETNAETAETNAELAETNALASANAAAASYDAFDDRYLGSKTSDPTLDNDGDPLLTGALYWNSVTPVMRVYNGATWSDITSALSLAAGSYTPTLTAVTGNISSLFTVGAWRYTRVGNNVIVTGNAVISSTVSGSTQFYASLPIASTFTSNDDVSGVATMNGMSQGAGYVARASLAPTVMWVLFNTATTAGSSSVGISMSYEIK